MSEPVGRWVGTDRVMIREGRLVIHSQVDMEGWDVRDHRKPLIHFDDRTWQLVRKVPGHQDTIRYELEPWTPNTLELPGRQIHYGPAYVDERDRDLAALRRRNAERLVLGLLSPLVGLLGAGTKRRLEEVYEIDPVTVTTRSLCLEYLVILLAGTSLSISVVVSALGFPPPIPIRPLLVLVLIVIPDAAIRYGRLLAEERYPPGFYQWVWKRKSR